MLMPRLAPVTIGADAPLALTRGGPGAGTLQACGGDVDAALKRYNAERLPDVQALLNLNQMWIARLGSSQEVGMLEGSDHQGCRWRSAQCRTL